MRRAALFLGLVLVTPAALAADQPPYLDDRSAPEAVIQSFYNAIDRAEFVRAYSYYQDGEGVGDFDTFLDGYAETEKVSVATGAATGDGAAGSTYYTVPVALDVDNKDGTHLRFAGCYTVRLVNPQVQAEPPFRPMYIVEGKLQASDGKAGSPPASCAQ